MNSLALESQFYVIAKGAEQTKAFLKGVHDVLRGEERKEQPDSTVNL